MRSTNIANQRGNVLKLEERWGAYGDDLDKVWLDCENYYTLKTRITERVYALEEFASNI